MSDDRRDDEDLFDRRRGGRDRDDDNIDREDRPRSRRDDYDDDYDDRGPAPFPPKLRLAGRIWLVIGILIIITGAIGFVTQQQQKGNDKDQAVGGGCGILGAVLIGGIFIHVGLQSINGTAKDTMGNAVGSLILGLLPGAIGIFALVAARVEPMAAVLAVLWLSESAALIGAGVLAIMAREDYLAWKTQNKAGPGRRFDNYAGRSRRNDRDWDDDRERR